MLIKTRKQILVLLFTILMSWADQSLYFTLCLRYSSQKQCSPFYFFHNIDVIQNQKKVALENKIYLNFSNFFLCLLLFVFSVLIFINVNQAPKAFLEAKVFLGTPSKILPSAHYHSIKTSKQYLTAPPWCFFPAYNFGGNLQLLQRPGWI